MGLIHVGGGGDLCRLSPECYLPPLTRSHALGELSGSLFPACFQTAEVGGGGGVEAACNSNAFHGGVWSGPALARRVWGRETRLRAVAVAPC